MRVLICGSRHWDDGRTIAAEVAKLPADTTVITGGAAGADTHAAICARLCDLKVEVHYADWVTHGKAAGPIRNREMLDSGVDLVLAFTRDLSQSRGTAHMVRIARAAGVEVRVIGEDQP